MAKICNNKKAVSSEYDNKNERSYMKCHFKLHYPTTLLPENFSSAIQQLKQEKEKHSLLCNNQAQIGKGKFVLPCHIESHKKQNELKRKKLIQKIKELYNIDLEGLNENIKNEIIMKVRIMEKEKKEKVKGSVNRSLNIISTLLEEQKYKQREMRKFVPFWRRRAKTESTEEVCVSADQEEQENSREESPTESLEETCEELTSQKVEENSPTQRLTKYIIRQKKSEIEEPQEYTGELDNYYQDTFPCGSIAKPSKVTPMETDLECTPKRVVFENYKEGEVYFQDLKITNIGLETVHCRYLGIGVTNKSEKRFPIGVAVRDNVKLRPGLSCSTKIRLCSEDASKELECSVVYETRRQKKPLEHSWFFVPILCTPPRAQIKISPLKFIFPALTWCIATSPEGRKQLTRTLKIENIGGKSCSCKFTTRNVKDDRHLSSEVYGEYTQTVTSNENSVVLEEPQRSPSSSSHEVFLGEAGHQMGVLETVEELLNELFDNVFTSFRFSEKYHIEIPAFSIKEIKITFIPEYQGFHHEISIIEFEDCQNCTEENIEMIGEIEKLPLTAIPAVIDLKICVANSAVCAGKFTVYNECEKSYSVKLKIPHSVKEHASVYPKAATIHSFGSREFSVIIHPRVTFFQNPPLHYNEDTGLFEFPIKIHSVLSGKCLLDHIKVVVFALITDYTLELSPSEIDFETVSTLETVKAQIQLTNHSLAIQEFGFLNLPKGVRVEPNFGFGKILPKETIRLNLLYSPGQDLIEGTERESAHLFDVRVTSIAEHGGFGEKLEFMEETVKYFNCDDYENKFDTSELKSNSGEDPGEKEQSEKSEDDDECLEEISSLEGEELTSKIHQKEIKIREFLKQDRDKQSEDSFSKRTSGQEHSKSTYLLPSGKTSEATSSVSQIETHGEAYWEKKPSLYPGMNTIKCKARIVVPYCHLSETVIQLPATPCSSYSLYRFWLGIGNKIVDSNCTCKPQSKKFIEKIEGRFEFQCKYPQIKFEPQSGSFRGGDIVAVTIIFQPELPGDMSRQESTTQRAKKMMPEKKSEQRISFTLKSSTSAKSKRKERLSQNRKSTNSEDFDVVTFNEIEKQDLFSEKRNLLKVMSPFQFETHVRCLLEIWDGESPKMEHHNMVLICPVIKPNFVYLGGSQEINFGKVPVGTKSRVLLQVENTSLKRISPMISLLDPCGPFFCPAGLGRVQIDPEHVWSQPLTFAPLTTGKIEKEFFTISHGPTNLFLTVSGEGIEPSIKTSSNTSEIAGDEDFRESKMKTGNQTTRKSRISKEKTKGRSFDSKNSSVKN